MAKTHLREGDLVLPEELPSTQNLTALVARTLSGVEPQHEAEMVLTAEVPAATNGNGNHGGPTHSTYTVAYLKYDEVMLKGDGPNGSWIKVVKIPSRKTGGKRDDDGWMMKEHDKPTFTMPVPTTRFLGIQLDPKQAIFAELAGLHKKLKMLKWSLELTGNGWTATKLRVSIEGVEKQIEEKAPAEVKDVIRWRLGPKQVIFAELMGLYKKLRGLKKSLKKTRNAQKMVELRASIEDIEKQVEEKRKWAESDQFKSLLRKLHGPKRRGSHRKKPRPAKGKRPKGKPSEEGGMKKPKKGKKKGKNKDNNEQSAAGNSRGGKNRSRK